jgi:hypothetical protein
LNDFTAMAGEPGPMLEPLRDEAYFSRVFLEFGAPTWPNDFDIDPEALRRQMAAAGELTQPPFSTSSSKPPNLCAMNERVRIEVDEATALLLEARAAARGMTVAELIAELAGTREALSADLQVLRDAGDGPWAPEILAEDARRLADFHRTRQAVPWDDVRAWMQTWGTPHELPVPKPRKL